MPVKPIPEGYHGVTPYLVVEDAAGTIQFAQTAFGAHERFRSTAPDGSVMHAEITIGDSVVMIGQASDQWQPTNAMLHMYVEDVDAAYERALAAGATSIREVRDEFYGDRSGGVQTGTVTWWLATHVEDVSPEEIDRRSSQSAH
jgi:uncharacterized glyoxalase superfamily protein PhnB